MSSDRQRLVGAIRRIALTPEERRQLLGDSANRGDQAGAGAKAASQGEQERICCDGSTAPPNAGTEERDPDSASQTGLDSNDPARLTAGDGTLSGVTDCATGEPICMDGSSHIPPEGWDAPNEPPEEEYYNPAWYYEFRVGNFGTVLLASNSCTAVATAFIAAQEDNCGFAPTVDTICGGTSLGNLRGFSCGGVDRTVWRLDCVDSPDAACNDDPPTADAWPSDGCVNLAIKSGTIVGSKYDPDQSGAYSTPKTSIELCDGATSILYQPLPGGGFRTIESSGGVAVSGAVGYTYSSDGTLTGTITQAEWDATAP